MSISNVCNDVIVDTSLTRYMALILPVGGHLDIANPGNASVSQVQDAQLRVVGQLCRKLSDQVMIQPQLLEGCAVDEGCAQAGQLVVGHGKLVQGCAAVQAGSQV